VQPRHPWRRAGSDHGGFHAGHISTDEARQIILGLIRRSAPGRLKFYPGVGYRHLLVWKGGGPVVETTPPHDITGQATAQYLPKGKGATRCWI